MPVEGDELGITAGQTPNLSDLVAGLCDALSECSLRHRDPSDGGVLPKRKNLLVLTSAISTAGIDGEALVRYGLVNETALPLAIALAFDAIDGLSPQGREWADALGLGAALALPNNRSGSFVDMIGPLITNSVPAVRRWVYNAPFADIASLAPPSADVQRHILESSDPPSEMCEQYRWIADRMTAQSSEHWATGSLESEYRWRRGHAPANLPCSVLIEIDITTEEIATELADRRLLRDHPRHSMPGLSRHADEQAKAFLHDHRYAEAAAIFEFMGEREMLPRRECLNNRGFCFIPVDPERALHLLQRAAASGYTPASVNCYNQMCCKLAAGDAPGVRALSENYWSEQFEEDPVGAALWSPTDSGWVLDKAADAREAIASLALAIARKEGWPDRVRRWKLRLAALRSTGEHIL